MGDDGSPEDKEDKEESPAAPSAGSEELIKLLEERLELYKQAETKAKNNNDTSKARRYNRGVKTLQGMLRDAKAGKNVNEADIPPLLPRSATQVSQDTNADQGIFNIYLYPTYYI